MTANKLSLLEKSILVTGSSSGIGKNIALTCSKLGGNIILTGRNELRLSSVYNELCDKRKNCKYIVDFSLSDKLGDFADQLPELDGVVLNVGSLKTLPVAYLTSEDIESTFQVNLFSHMMLVKHLIKKRKLKKNASIVFVSSISGSFRVSVGNSMYAASKSALDAFMKTTALELAPKGIRCNSVNPGFIQTDMVADKAISSDQLKIELAKYPLGRFGLTSDVANAVVFLLSDLSTWITGVNLKVDGGRTL